MTQRSSQPIRVLMSYAKPSINTNPFTLNLGEGLAEEVEVLYLDAASMLWRRFDVLHIHWPENLFLAASRPRRFLKTFLGLMLLARARFLNRPIVYTKHNIVPHERPGQFYGALYRWIERSAIARIYLNESTENEPSEGVTILHGDYPKADHSIVELPRSDRRQTNLLFFGQFRRYKGVEALLRGFRAQADPLLRLKMRGAIPDDAYRLELSALVGDDTRIDFEPGFIADVDLETHIAASDIVVLPYPHIYNSGVALLALSRGKPILVPDCPSTRTLQDEVGNEFVHLFQKPFTTAALDNLHTLAGLHTTDRPRLDRRDWAAICRLHVRLYAIAIGARGEAPNKRAKVVRLEVAADPSFVRHSHRNTLVVNYAPG